MRTLRALPALGITVLAALVLVTCASRPAGAGQDYLQANFNDKTIDEQIGTGGPTLGEPVSVNFGNIDAIVDDTPFATPCLALFDLSDCCGGEARFEFLDEAEIGAGPLVVSAQVWIPNYLEAGYTLGLRERGTAAHTFVDLHFASNGSIGCSDAGGFVGEIAPYLTGQIISVRVVLDMTAGTYDVWIDDVLWVDDQPHDVVGVAVGALVLTCMHDAGIGDFFYVDNLFVGDYDPTPTTPASWGSVKGLYRSGAGE
jgi:hypothetical protein